MHEDGAAASADLEPLAMRGLYQLSREAGAGPRRTVPLMICISGLATSLLLALTNLGAEQTAEQATFRIDLLVGYLVTLGVLFEARRFALVQSALAFESALVRYRARLIDKLRPQQLWGAEDLQESALGTLADNVRVLSQAAASLGLIAESLVILFAIVLYIAWLSPASVVAILLVYIVTVPIYLARSVATREKLRRAAAKDRRFLGDIRALLKCFESQKLHPSESSALVANLHRRSAASLQSMLAYGARYTTDTIFATSTFYLALLTIGFLTPTLVPELEDRIHKVIAALLFTLAPLAQLVNGVPILVKAEAAVRQLYAAEAELDSRPSAANEGPNGDQRSFETLEFSRVFFHLSSKTPERRFVVGPVDLLLSPGDRLFLVGANGSGKSTLLRGLAGLYPPDGGEIHLGGRLVTDLNRSAHRALFTGILRAPGPEEGLSELSSEELEVLKTYAPETYRTLLPGPQDATCPGLGRALDLAVPRALATVLLENRPICVFDDIMAGRDIESRRCFYEEILGSLSHEGRTTLVVSHDEAFFHVADRFLYVNDGEVMEQAKPSNLEPQLP